MARYVKSVAVWALDHDERNALQPGQHITAGGAPGRWCGCTDRSDVAAWRGGDGKGMHNKMRALIEYAKSGTSTPKSW